MFVHASIRTSNMDKSIEFYSKFFGLKVLSRSEIEQTNAEVAFLQDPTGKGCILELTLYHNQTKFTQPVYEERMFDHLGFVIQDMDKTLAAMRSENIVIFREPFKLGKSLLAFVEDPDGTLVELIQKKTSV